MMHPFSAAAVPRVEIAAGRLIVVLPEEAETPTEDAEAAPGAAAEGN
jgi:hypothetical protein